MPLVLAVKQIFWPGDSRETLDICDESCGYFRVNVALFDTTHSVVQRMIKAAEKHTVVAEPALRH